MIARVLWASLSLGGKEGMREEMRREGKKAREEENGRDKRGWDAVDKSEGK
jgi:hypothetical protein